MTSTAYFLKLYIYIFISPHIQAFFGSQNWGFLENSIWTNKAAETFFDMWTKKEVTDLACGRWCLKKESAKIAVKIELNIIEHISWQTIGWWSMTREMTSDRCKVTDPLKTNDSPTEIRAGKSTKTTNNHQQSPTFLSLQLTAFFWYLDGLIFLGHFCTSNRHGILGYKRCVWWRSGVVENVGYRLGRRNLGLVIRKPWDPKWTAARTQLMPEELGSSLAFRKKKKMFFCCNVVVSYSYYMLL